MAVRLFGLLFAVLVLLFVFLLINYSDKNDPRSVLEQNVEHTLHVPCNINQNVCLVRFGELSVDLSLLPKNAKALEPLSVRLSSGNRDLLAADWHLWFQGRDMDMGVHWLQPKAQGSAPTLEFAGMIPVCTVDPDMTWQLIAQVELEGQNHRIIFEFLSTH